MDYTIVLILLQTSLLGMAHWFPHLRTLIGKPLEHPVRLRTNYVIGVTCVNLPFTAWTWRTFSEGIATFESIALWLWIFYAIGGIWVWLMYRLDDLVEWLIKTRSDKALHEQSQRK